MITRIHVGVDISKRWFDVYFALARQEFAVRYDNTPEGIRLFLEWILSLGARKVHICMEFTGGYETALAIAAREARLIVSIVDGAKIADYRKSFTRTGAGTDKKSAYLLARFCKERRPEVWFPVPDEYRELRELVRHRERLIEAKAQWACRAERRSEQPVVQAQRGTIVQVFALQIQEIQEAIRKHIQTHRNLAAQMELLLSIPSIAFKTASRILAEAGPIDNYPSAKALALAAGLVPIVVHSGQSTPPGKLPIYGNRELRNALFFPALVSKRSGKGVGSFIQRIEKSNKSKMTAVVAGMRKLAHVVYGVLTSGKPYNPDLLHKTT